MAPFYGWGSTASSKATATLRGGSLLFTTQFPEIPGTHFIYLAWKEAELTLEPPSASGFEYGTPGFGIQPLNHLAIAPCQAFVYNLPELS